MYLFIFLVSLSIFELNTFQAAMLFISVAVVLVFVVKSRHTTFEPIVLVLIAYIAGFPIPALLPDFYPSLWESVKPYSIEQSMLWSLRGFCAFAVGYVLVKKTYRPKIARLRHDQIACSFFVLRFIGWLALVGWALSVLLYGFSLTFIESTNSGNTQGGGFGQIFHLFEMLRLPFILVFLIMRFWGFIDQHLLYLFRAILTVSIVEIISIGSKGAIIQLVIVLVLVFSFLPIRLRSKQILIGFFALLAVYTSFTIISEYRALMRNALVSGANVFSFEVQAHFFQEAITHSLPFEELQSDRLTEFDKGDMVLERFGSGMFSFANLLERTSFESPYENAVQSFMVLIYSVMPRGLFGDKVQFFSSGDFAKKFFGWSYGGVSVSLLGSFYYAWGYTGIILGMFLMGSLLAFVYYRSLAFGISSLHSVIVFTIFLLMLLNVGMTFQAIITNFIRVVLLLAMIRWLYHNLYQRSAIRV